MRSSALQKLAAGNADIRILWNLLKNDRIFCESCIRLNCTKPVDFCVVKCYTFNSSLKQNEEVFLMKNNRRVKGFTLTELIVVIAIIGILAAILAPSMNNYYKSSRIKDENSNARMVYNAAQTQMQGFISQDRTAPVKSPFNGTLILAYYEDGRILVSSSGLDSALQPISGADEQVYKDLVADINRTVSDAEKTNWAVCIENYVVKGSMSAESPSTNYIGRYSARGASGERSEAQGPSSQGYSAQMATGKTLADFADQFYGLDSYTTTPANP